MLSLIFSVVTSGKDYFFYYFPQQLYEAVWEKANRKQEQVALEELGSRGWQHDRHGRYQAPFHSSWTGQAGQVMARASHSPVAARQGQGADAAPWPSCVSGMAKDVGRPRPSCSMARAGARAEVQAPGVWRRPFHSSVTHGSVPAAGAGLASFTPRRWPWVWAAKAPVGMYICACGPPRRYKCFVAIFCMCHWRKIITCCALQSSLSLVCLNTRLYIKLRGLLTVGFWLVRRKRSHQCSPGVWKGHSSLQCLHSD